MDKTYEPQKFEKDIYSWWENAGFFKPPMNGAEPFTIIMPPPNITAQLHVGHALDNSVQDCIIRYKRMKGFNTLWVPGTDHASIATEVKIIEKLREEGLDKHQLGREKFLERAWQWREKYGRRIAVQLRSLGSSCDWSREEFTMGEKPSRAVRHVFVKLYKNVPYRARGLFAHGELFPRPVAARAQAPQLNGNAPPVFFAPLPRPLQKLLPAELMFVQALFAELFDYFDFRGNRRVVGAGHPKRVEALHSLIPDYAVLHRVVERVPDVKLRGNVGRRHNDCKRLRSVHRRLEKARVFPPRINILLKFLRFVSFVHNSPPVAFAVVIFLNYKLNSKMNNIFTLFLRLAGQANQSYILLFVFRSQYVYKRVRRFRRNQRYAAISKAFFRSLQGMPIAIHALQARHNRFDEAVVNPNTVIFLRLIQIEPFFFRGVCLHNPKLMLRHRFHLQILVRRFCLKLFSLT